ncbi:MAG: Bax inhibitor-1/YccA family protein [Planctomycetales bacterium]|nr:Bax inhibitor-1/YccA family protein [Planctomycetales bacterium]
MNSPSMQSNNPYASFGMSVADAPADARVGFIRRTYLHLTLAVYTLVMLDWVILSSGVMDDVMPMLINSKWGMLIMFGGFIAVSWIAQWWANSESSSALQYTGLAVYVVAEAIFLAPLLYFAESMTLDVGSGVTMGVIPAAGLATLVVFAGLTAIAWFSGADFSFLRSALMLAGVGAFGLILASMFIGFNLGVWFSVGMIVFASGYILYDTSNVLHHYRPSQHVAASLALFASVALLFWYLLRLFMALANRD